MVECRATLRSPEGKTVEVLVEFDDKCCIRRAVVGGDFFVFPGEAVDIFEDSLVGCCGVDCVEFAARRKLGGAVLAGARVEDFVRLVSDCFRRVCGLVSR